MKKKTNPRNTTIYGGFSGTWHIFALHKGNRTIADLRYGGKDIISPSTLIFAPIKG